MPRTPIVHPAIILDLRIDIAVTDETETPKFRRFEKWVRAESIADSRRDRIGIGRYGIYFGAAGVVVKSNIADSEMLDRIGRRRARPEAGYLGVFGNRVVGVERPIAEIPHHFLRRLWIVRIDQREWQPGGVALQRSVGRELHLRVIFFRRRLVW